MAGRAWPLTFIAAFRGCKSLAIVYAGVRHLLWDNSKVGMNAEKESMFELDEIKKSSELVLYGSAGLTLLLSLYYYTV